MTKERSSSLFCALAVWCLASISLYCIAHPMFTPACLPHQYNRSLFSPSLVLMAIAAWCDHPSDCVAAQCWLPQSIWLAFDTHTHTHTHM